MFDESRGAQLLRNWIPQGQSITVNEICAAAGISPSQANYHQLALRVAIMAGLESSNVHDYEYTLFDPSRPVLTSSNFDDDFYRELLVNWHKRYCQQVISLEAAAKVLGISNRRSDEYLDSWQQVLDLLFKFGYVLKEYFNSTASYGI